MTRTRKRQSTWEDRQPRYITRGYIDVTAQQLELAHCTSYTGGSAWFKSPEFDGWLVFSGTPVEIRKYFAEHPSETVRMAQVLQVT